MIRRIIYFRSGIIPKFRTIVAFPNSIYKNSNSKKYSLLSSHKNDKLLLCCSCMQNADSFDRTLRLGQETIHYGKKISPSPAFVNLLKINTYGYSTNTNSTQPPAPGNPDGEHKDNTSSSSSPQNENIYTVPNFLCVARIGMAPLLGYMIVTSQFTSAIGIFALAGVTDLLDGWIARSFQGQSSMLGSFLDPLSDKLLVGAVFISLTYMDLIPLSLTALILARDAFLISAGFYIRYQSLEPPRTLSRYFNASYPTAQLAPTFISKVNTGVQLGLVGVTLISTVITNYDIQPYLVALWYFTAGTTICSALSYIFTRNTYKILKNSKDWKSKVNLSKIKKTLASSKEKISKS